MSAKGRKRQKKSIEDIYCNNNFVPPREQNLETIFEEPRKSKDGAPMLTSVKKYKRYLHFDPDLAPTQNKIRKRKRNAKKCVKKLKTSHRTTRSSPKDSECDEMSHYLGILEDTSSDSDTDIASSAYSKVTVRSDTPAVKRSLPKKTLSSEDPDRESSCTDVFGTPKKNRSGFRRLSSSNSGEINLSLNKISTAIIETEEDVKITQEQSVEKDEVKVQSPRSSCQVS